MATELDRLPGASADWEPLFWTVFASSRNSMAVVDADRVVIAANPALARLVGRAEAELEGAGLDGWLAAEGDGEREWRALLARGQGTWAGSVRVAGGSDVPATYAGHVAHVGGRLAVLLVLMFGDPPGPDRAGLTEAAALTPRELEIVRRLAMGATSREIAQELHVTPETVRTHVRNAMAKTGTRTRAHLVAAAICRGFLPDISSN